jgi:phosphinothricin acetyltransferase
VTPSSTLRADTVVRSSDEGDLPIIHRIYGHHVVHGLASFEETPPDLDDLGRRRQALVAAGFPYLVAERRGQVLGYAYAGPYRPRSAYRYAVEDSVYVAPDAVGAGVGRELLRQLIVRCETLGKRQMMAVIGDSANHASIRLHAQLGFRHVGTIEAIGFKHGRWVDSVLMQRPLGPGSSTRPETLSG